MTSLILRPLPSIPVIQQGDDLASIILEACQIKKIHLKDGDILVITSKIISKAEGRLVNLMDITASDEAKALATRSGKDPRLADLILKESRVVLRVRPGTVIVEHRLGFICANAGIDHSNIAPPSGIQSHLSNKSGRGVSEWVLLLPVNPDRSAAGIRTKLEAATQKHLGVMIVDSHGRAWRLGVVGTCIGLSGLPAIVDKRGQKDLVGYTLQITLIAAADELAGAASLVMGQADEGTPVVHVRGFPYSLREGSFSELPRPIDEDMFR